MDINKENPCSKEAASVNLHVEELKNSFTAILKVEINPGASTTDPILLLLVQFLSLAFYA